MSKAGGILGIIGGIFGLIAAVITLFIGGLGSTFNADGASGIVGFGWGGIVFSIGAIIFGATAFAKPKISGILLILTSLAGAILGGTFVAVCLVLSLIGGILALFAAKKPVLAKIADSNSATVESGKSKQLYTRLGLGALGLVGVIFFGSNLINKDKTPGADTSTQVKVQKSGPLETLAAAMPSSTRPDGQLAELFSFGSKNTDLQRENALRELKGEVVAWRLPVYDVQRRGDSYKIQTHSTRNYVGAFVTITPRNDEERRVVEALTTGEMIAFKGIIKDTTMRNFDIAPAILDRPAAKPQAAVPTSTPPLVPQAQNASIALTDELVTVAGLLEAVDDKLFLGSTIVTREMDAMNLAIAGGWPSATPAKYALILLNSGGSACPATFKIVNLIGSISLTRSFGNCSDIPTASYDGKKLRIEFGAIGSAPPERYEYEDGKLAKLN